MRDAVFGGAREKWTVGTVGPGQRTRVQKEANSRRHQNHQ